MIGQGVPITANEHLISTGFHSDSNLAYISKSAQA
jgi:hypothetical protein